MTEEFLLLQRIKLIILSGLLLLTACNREDKGVVELLDRADSLLRVNPDSALKLLSPLSHSPSLSSPPLGEVGRGLGMKSRMCYQLLLADALNKTCHPMPSDTMMKEVVDYYDRHGNANERMRAHYLLGRVYHDMGEAPIALECYQQAAEQADTTSADCDLHVLHLIYGQMADLYYYQYLPDDEMQALKNCERIAWKEHDTIPALKAYELRLRPYYQKNDTDSVLYYVNTSYQLYKKYGYNKEASIALNMKISTLVNRHKWEEVRKYMDIFERESGLFDKEGNIQIGRELYYRYRGCYLLGIGNPDSALYWFNRVHSYGYKEAGYKGMLEVYKQKHIPDSIAKYAELFAKANDDSYLENSMELVSKQTQLYNYERNRKIAEQKERELSQIKLYVSYAAIVLLCISIVLYVLYQKNNIKRRLQIFNLTEKYNASVAESRQISEKVLILKSLCNTLEQDKDNIKKNLEEQLNILHVELKKRTAEIKETEEDLQRYKNRELENNLFKSETGRYFDSLRTSSGKNRKLPTQKDWEKLGTLITICRPKIAELLREHPSLTEKEKHLLYLLLIGYKGKIISITWNVSYPMLSNTFSRINKKLFESNDSRSLKDNLTPFYIKK